MDRRFEPGDEPLVGVHQLVRHRGDLPGVAQQSGDEAPRDLGEPHRVLGVVERVGVLAPQRQVGVHPRSLDALERLGHERGVHPGAHRHLTHDHAQRHEVVGHRERIGVAQVDLVLGRCVLVEGVLDGDARGLESLDGPAADVGGLVVGGEVEVAGVVEGVRCSAAVVGGEVEELDLRCAHELEAVVRGLGEVALEHLAGVALERGAVELGDVTEDPRR